MKFSTPSLRRAAAGRVAGLPGIVASVALMTLAACAGIGTADAPASPVTIRVSGPNAVTVWNQVATDTINQPSAASGTEAERRPLITQDLASVHLAIYDALTAIDPTYRPYRATPLSDARGASSEAAIAAAAYGVLSGLYPSRSATYRPAYERALAAVTDASARDKGVALGTEAARAVLGWRAADGRSAALPPFVPGTAAGAYRGPGAINRDLPALRPFAMTGAAQFRAAGPRPLTSAAYAKDVNETAALGGAASTARSAQQLEIARFHTEAPPAFWPRNLRRFAMTERPLMEQSRLLAMLMVVTADAEIACFESKYHHVFWRPSSAITMADSDGNDATTADPAWRTVLPTPPHPEYPAAHACVSSAVAETLNAYFGTDRVTFTMDSSVTGSTHDYVGTQALVDEVVIARIAGGMHFRSSLSDGAELGRAVAQWVVRHHFQRR